MVPAILSPTESFPAKPSFDQLPGYAYLPTPKTLLPFFPTQETYHLLSSLITPPTRYPQQDIRDDDLPSTTETIPSEILPLYAIAIIFIVLFTMSSAFLYYLCRCLMRKKKREQQLASITPKDPRMAGVTANHTIEFVVPTTILMNECVLPEDSSETDNNSSSSKVLPVIKAKRTMRRSFSGFHINPEDLQHGLYVGVKAASEKGTFLGDLGKVGFSLNYNSLRNQLTVHLIGARDLPCHFLKTTANPCAKIVLLPDRTTKYMTKVQRNTTDPDFNESFVFCLRREELLEKVVKISVWDYDRFSRKCLVGQVTYCVRDSGIGNCLGMNTREIWVDLKPDSSAQHPCAGELLFSLCYNAEAANLTLTVLKAKGLSMQRDKGKDTAVYAKVTLYVRRKLVRTKKTPAIKKLPEVHFNSSFDVHLPQGALGEVDMLVSLCEKGRPGIGQSGRVIGKTQVGANCLCDQGLQHWQDMLLSQKSTCAQWHVLSCP